VSADLEHPETPAETRAEDLSDELAKKYDPERLLKIISKRAGRGEQLEHSVRARYEKKLGVDLSHVRVYSGEFAEEFNRKRNAYAVTVGGTGMVLMGGSPDKAMHSAAGQALLAHELTHVAQAAKGARGLHRKAYNDEMTFGHEHEEGAEQIEDEVMAEELGAAMFHADARGADLHGAAKKAAEDGMRRQIEQIKERVIDLAGEAARGQIYRNGSAPRRA
jgi:hypothetical protein